MNSHLLSFGSTHHTKDITDFALAPGLVYSSSLDQTVRIWDVDSGEHLHCASFDSAVQKIGVFWNKFNGDEEFYSHRLASAANHEGPMFGVGLSSGKWTVQRRHVAAAANPIGTGTGGSRGANNMTKFETLKSGAGLASSRHYKADASKRGKSAPRPDDDAILVTNTKRQKLNTVEHLMRKFEYRKALDHALSCTGSHNSSSSVPQTNSDNKNSINKDGKEIANKKPAGSYGGAAPGYSLAFLDELLARNALRQAVANRSEASCIEILHFVLRMIPATTHQDSQTFRNIILHLFNELIDTNPCLHTASSPAVVDLLQKIQAKIKEELALQKHVMNPMVGILDTLLSQ